MIIFFMEVGNCFVVCINFYLNISSRGLHPQTEFVFDLKLPESFTPANQVLHNYMLIAQSIRMYVCVLVIIYSH